MDHKIKKKGPRISSMVSTLGKFLETEQNFDKEQS